MTGGGGGLHSSSATAAAPGSNREMMQILRAQHQQLQMQWQAQAQAKAEAQVEAQAEAESQAQQEGAVTIFRRRQPRRSELFTSSGGSSAGTASSMGINFRPSSAVPRTSSNGGRIPPPFAFKYSLSDRSLGTGGSVVAAAATTAATGAASSTTGTATEGGLQRFRKRPSESIYANNEVEMTDASSHHPQGDADDDDDEVCIEIHSTTFGTGVRPPSSQSAGDAAAAASVRLTTGTSGTSSSSHSISPPCHQTDAATANATIKAPAIRFFNNGVEVNETGVPIVSPAVPAKPLDHQVKIPLSSQAQRHVTNEETDGNGASGITANTASPYFAANKNAATKGDEASLSPPLSRSCSLADVISFAVKRVPELSTRMILSNNDEADTTKIDDVLQALYAIASDGAKSETSPKAPAAATDAVESQQVRQTDLLQARLSTTIRSVEGYRRGKAIEVADEKASSLADGSRLATTTKSTAAAVVGPHADLINKIFGGGSQHKQKHRPSADGRAKRPDIHVDRPALEESSGSESTLGESNCSLNDMVRDSFAQREKHVDAATALLGLGDGRQ